MFIRLCVKWCLLYLDQQGKESLAPEGGILTRGNFICSAATLQHCARAPDRDKRTLECFAITLCARQSMVSAPARLPHYSTARALSQLIAVRESWSKVVFADAKRSPATLARQALSLRKPAYGQACAKIETLEFHRW